MVKENRIFPSSLSTYRAQLRRIIRRSISAMKFLHWRSPIIFIIGFLCAWLLFSNFAGETKAQSALPSNITFSGESNVIYFLDRDNLTLYRYNTQGRLTRSYIIEELGKDLKSK